MADDGRAYRIRRIGAAVDEVHAAAQAVLAIAVTAGDQRHFAPEFLATLSILEAVGHIDELVDASRWVVRAYGYVPNDLGQAGEGELESAVVRMRAAIVMFDEAYSLSEE